ncbi:hypothetical protein ACU8NH_09000 [Rhizobium leguminosarum]
MDRPDIVQLAIKAKRDAALVVDRHTNPSQKAASLALYDVMASCMELCERCELDSAEQTALECLFKEQPKTGNRRYVEKGSDIYVMVCRFVFTETDRTNAMRYASALREASKLQLSSENLSDWMRGNGGVNALYFRRPLDARRVKTKCLRLAEQIEFSRDEPFTLTLRWQDDNTFAVIT